LSLVPAVKTGRLKLAKFIDFDKNHKIFYDNIYLDEFKFVIKIPLYAEEESNQDIKIKKFDLTKYTYLLSYD